MEVTYWTEQPDKLVLNFVQRLPDCQTFYPCRSCLLDGACLDADELFSGVKCSQVASLLQCRQSCLGCPSVDACKPVARAVHAAHNQGLFTAPPDLLNRIIQLN